jgi:D-lactate dehydrogenase
MKVVVFDVEEWEHAACLRLQPEHELTCTRNEIDKTTVLQYPEAEVVSTFVASKLSPDVLRRLPQLRLIATRSTGFDHVDLDYCREHGITVSNVPSYGDVTVAEHVFALLLAISRHVVDAVERTRRGAFTQVSLRGFDLRGRCLGVIGVGRIGRRVIEIAKGFGMEIAAFDARPDHDSAEKLGYQYLPMREVLQLADVVTLHVPANASTNNLISDAEFAAMKPGAVLINTARGRVVDVAALVRALRSGKLRAAGLDVLPQERLLRDEAEIFRTAKYDDEELRSVLASNVLLQFPNVIVTPHNAYNTVDAVHRIIETTIENIEAFARGAPKNVVT